MLFTLVPQIHASMLSSTDMKGWQRHYKHVLVPLFLIKIWWPILLLYMGSTIILVPSVLKVACGWYSIVSTATLIKVEATVQIWWVNGWPPQIQAQPVSKWTWYLGLLPTFASPNVRPMSKHSAKYILTPLCSKYRVASQCSDGLAA